MVVACHCEGRGWRFWGDSNLKSKFWGRSIQLDPVGVLTLEFDDGEIFQWSKVDARTPSMSWRQETNPNGELRAFFLPPSPSPASGDDLHLQPHPGEALLRPLRHHAHPGEPPVLLQGQVQGAVDHRPQPASGGCRLLTAAIEGVLSLPPSLALALSLSLLAGAGDSTGQEREDGGDAVREVGREHAVRGGGRRLLLQGQGATGASPPLRDRPPPVAAL